MFKRILSVALQTLLLLAVFGVGSLLPAVPGRPIPMWRVDAGATHYFVLDGLLLMFVVFLVILAVEAARKVLAYSGKFTTLAFALALALGLLMKFGLMDKTTGL